MAEAFVEIHEHTEVYGVWLVAQPPCECGECMMSDVMVTLLRDGEEDWRAVVRVATRRGERVSKTGSTARKRGATREEAVAMAESVVATVRDAIRAMGGEPEVEHVRIDAKGTEAMDRFLKWTHAHPQRNAPGGSA